MGYKDFLDTGEQDSQVQQSHGLFTPNKGNCCVVSINQSILTATASGAGFGAFGRQVLLKSVVDGQPWNITSGDSVRVAACPRRCSTGVLAMSL